MHLVHSCEQRRPLRCTPIRFGELSQLHHCTPHPKHRFTFDRCEQMNERTRSTCRMPVPAFQDVIYPDPKVCVELAVEAEVCGRQRAEKAAL